MLHIRLPFAVPYIFSALKISITLAIIGAVVAEFVAAEHGLGFFIMFSTSFFKIPQAFAGLAVLVALSLGAVPTVHAGAALVRAVVAAEVGTMSANRRGPHQRAVSGAAWAMISRPASSAPALGASRRKTRLAAAVRTPTARKAGGKS